MPSSRVLLIDDDDDEYLIVQDLINQASHGRYILTWESSYSAGYAALVSEQYDVCLLDYRLGQRTGIDLLRSAIAEGCSTPVVLLTGQGDRELDIASMGAGAADYLVKGTLRPDDLERTLRRAIERTAAWTIIHQVAATHRAMMVGIPDTVFRLTPDGVILEYKAAIDSDPADRDVGPNTRLQAAYPVEVVHVLEECLSRAMASGTTRSCEFTIEGTFNRRHFEARIVPVEEGDEAIVIVRDFTKEKIAAQRLDDLTLAKSRFLESMSHELRTPLTSVLGHADLLHTNWSEFTAGERRDMLDTIAAGATKLGYLFDDALVMARDENEGLAIFLERVDLSPLAVKAVELFAHDANVDIEGTGESAWAVVDPMRLTTILRHLLSNAIIHGGNLIAIATGETDSRAWIEVRDDGNEIPAEARPWGYGSPDRSAPMLNTPAPIGLGLTVSQRLAQLMTGHLTYRYESDWSVFRLDLPAKGDNGGYVSNSE